MQKTKLKLGLRWSPRPMKEYLASWNLGPGVAAMHAKFSARPDAWNLFWISAANCETIPLAANQVRFVTEAAINTANAVVGGCRVGDLALSLMPLDFADHMEAHKKGIEDLALPKMLNPHWLWVIRDRSDLFYRARESEDGRTVSAPNSQGETILDESSNIVSFFKFKDRGGG